MATRGISQLRAELLRLVICAEPTILAKVQTGDGNGKKAAKKTQVREDGSVLFYYGNGPLWWQRLFNDYESVSIVDIAIRIADAITGSGGNRNEIAFDGLTKALLDEAVKNNDLDCVIDILFDSMRNASNGVLASKYINKKVIEKYAKEKGYGRIVETEDNLFGYVGVEIRPGVIVPIRIGKIKNYK